MAHRDTVCNGDGGKFTRCTQRLFHPHFHRLRLTIKRNVARGSFVPTGGHTYQGLMNFFFGHSHRVIIGTMGRTRRSFCDMAAWQFGFVEFAHGYTLSLDQDTSYKTQPIETSSFATHLNLKPKVV